MEDFVVEVKAGDCIESKNVSLESPEKNNQRAIVTRSKVFSKLVCCDKAICF